MGEAKGKEKAKERFLLKHPKCVYCGNLASTIEHCPARCFFLSRVWPETFEYPACSKCNSEARLDENALACLVRARTGLDANSKGFLEWEKLVGGVKNNRPELVAEWLNLTSNERKHSLRNSFGREVGDLMRQQGYGVINIGPETSKLIFRFSVRLARTLFYKHIGRIFRGTVWSQHFNLLTNPAADKVVEALLSIAPEIAKISRSGSSLSEQFAYRYNYSPETGVLYAAVHLSDQFTFYIMAAEAAFAERLIEGKVLPAMAQSIVIAE